MNLLKEYWFDWKSMEYCKKNFFIISVKLCKKNTAFGDTDIEEHKLYYNKNPILIDNVDINKIIVSNRVSCSKKGFKHGFKGFKQG